MFFLGGGVHRDVARAAPLGIEGAEIDQQRIGAGDERGDLLDRERHRRHAAGGQQHIGGEILRHRVGDAMNARAARAQALKREAGGLRHLVTRCCGMPHLSVPPPA